MNCSTRVTRMLTAQEIAEDNLESAEYLKNLQDRDQIIGYEQHKSNTSAIRAANREVE